MTLNEKVAIVTGGARDRSSHGQNSGTTWSESHRELAAQSDSGGSSRHGHSGDWPGKLDRLWSPADVNDEYWSASDSGGRRSSAWSGPGNRPHLRPRKPTVVPCS